jgi:anti-anti-sigma regulatory factor
VAKLNFFVENMSSHTLVKLTGALMEDTDFQPLLERVRTAEVHLDLGGITRINSCGVRDWIGFVRKLEDDGASVILERCPPVIVAQLVQVSGFSGRAGRVESVLAPFYCKKCDAEKLELLALNRPLEADLVMSCPHCKSPMGLDDYEDLYRPFTSGASWALGY